MRSDLLRESDGETQKCTNSNNTQRMLGTMGEMGLSGDVRLLPAIPGDLGAKKDRYKIHPVDFLVITVTEALQGNLLIRPFSLGLSGVPGLQAGSVHISLLAHWLLHSSDTAE